MSNVQILPSDGYGYQFIGSEYIPEGETEYYFRDKQADVNHHRWRNLTSAEIELLIKNGNLCNSWDDILVSDTFDPMQVRNNSFHGLVRIGRITDSLLRYHDFTLPCGITNSRIIACDIGDDCAIHSCAYMSHYIIGSHSILSCIDEMETTNHAKFGNGIIKEGESEKVRVWIDPLNEAGGRSVLPFEDMTCADAYMWMTYRDDQLLMSRLLEITQNSYDTRRGWYGTVGEHSVIKMCGVIKDTKFGSHCYVKGAHKLKNLTIRSDENEPTQIGEGVELVNGIIGFGSHIFYGCKAIRFVIGTNTSLKYGARLIHSILGDNSTISCCEVLNNLVFSGHEQHHNNSFLIAACVKGLSNMAAGATVGSNHNSRGNDGEIIAGRGFWPGLSSTLKHNCHFASYTLISKGNYPAELNVQFPFCMLVDNSYEKCRELMPAYYWMYNMYALERNSWKYSSRDKRVHIFQHLEFDYLAPDTAAEIITAMELLEKWIGKAWLRYKGQPAENLSTKDLQKAGRSLCSQCQYLPQGMEVFGENIERSKTPVRILKPIAAYHAYESMLIYYGVKTVAAYVDAVTKADEGKKTLTFDQLQTQFPKEPHQTWVNMGGQLIPEIRVNEIMDKIKDGTLQKWDQIHAEYDRCYEIYATDKLRDAMNVLRYCTSSDILNAKQWQALQQKTHEIRTYIEEQVYYTKAKDYKNYFRSITYRNKAEMDAVLGKIEDNPFITAAKEQSIAILKMVDAVTF